MGPPGRGRRGFAKRVLPFYVLDTVSPSSKPSSYRGDTRESVIGIRGENPNKLSLITALQTCVMTLHCEQDGGEPPCAQGPPGGALLYVHLSRSVLPVLWPGPHRCVRDTKSCRQGHTAGLWLGLLIGGLAVTSTYSVPGPSSHHILCPPSSRSPHFTEEGQRPGGVRGLPTPFRDRASV